MLKWSSEYVLKKFCNYSECFLLYFPSDHVPTVLEQAPGRQKWPGCSHRRGWWEVFNHRMPSLSVRQSTRQPFKRIFARARNPMRSEEGCLCFALPGFSDARNTLRLPPGKGGPRRTCRSRFRIAGRIWKTLSINCQRVSYWFGCERKYDRYVHIRYH